MIVHDEERPGPVRVPPRDGDDRPRPLGVLTTAAVSALAVGGTAGMAVAAGSLAQDALTGLGSVALMSAVLAAAATLGALCCAYLTLVWSLGTVVLLAGPASIGGRALLATLGVLAPRLARRVAAGAGIVAATATLSLAGAHAASPHGDPDVPATITTPVAGAASEALRTGGSGTEASPDPDATPARDPSPVVAAEAPLGGGDDTDPGADGPATPAEDGLPTLGWGDPSTGDDAPTGDDHGTGDDVPTGDHSGTGDAGADTGSVPDPAAAGDTDPRVTTVVVRPGDTLWGISDDLLGEGHESPAHIAEVWPRLHAENLDIIGPDPDVLVPGQVLTVPSDLSEQDPS